MAIINPFPHYSGFTQFTPVVPELYWNVYSQEERIKALCMEYVKLTAFTDSMVDTLNGQYAIIEEMQEQFPQLVNDDVIAEIRRLIGAGEFDDILQAEADRFLEEKTAQITANTEAIAVNTEAITANTRAIEINRASITSLSHDVDHISQVFTHSFENVAQMKTDEDLDEGMIVETLGFYTAGDGGAGSYIIVDNAEPNEMDIISISNGYYAVLKTGNCVTPEMFGAYGDATNNDAPAINRAISSGKKVNLLSKTYKISDPINVIDNMFISGMGSRVTRIICDNCDGFIMSGARNEFKTNVYIEHMQIIEKNSQKTKKGIYIQALNSIIYDVICRGFKYGFYFYANCDASTYQPLVNGGENHGANNCQALNCEYGFKLETWDALFNNLVSGSCDYGIENISNKLNMAHVWGWTKEGYLISGTENKPAMCSNLELEAYVGDETKPSQCIIGGSATISGFEVWNMGTDSPIFYIGADNVKLSVTGLSVGNYGSLNPDLTSSNIMPYIVRCTSSRANFNGYVQGTVLPVYKYGEVGNIQSDTSKFISAVSTSSNEATSIKDLVKPFKKSVMAISEIV